MMLALLSPVLPHLGLGLEWMTNRTDAVLAARVHAGASVAFGHGDVHPAVGLGLTAAAGSVADRRYFDAGPELQLGLQFGDDSLATNRVFVGCAIVATRGTTSDDTDMRGVRCALGASMAGWARELWREPRGFLMLVMPQEVELGWVHDASTTHFGITLSYGI